MYLMLVNPCPWSPVFLVVNPDLLRDCRGIIFSFVLLRIMIICSLLCSKKATDKSLLLDSQAASIALSIKHESISQVHNPV